MKRFALVVESDPERRTSLAAGRPYFFQRGTESVVGRAPMCDVVVDHLSVNRRNCTVEYRGDSLVVHDMGGQNGVWINDRRIAKEHIVRAGDRLRYGRDIVLRFDVVDDDALARARRVGDWVALDTGERRRCFRVDERGLTTGLLISFPYNSERAAVLRELAGARAAMPEIVDEWVDGAVRYRVLDADVGVPLLSLVQRAQPLAPSVAARILGDVTRALSLQYDATRAVGGAGDLVVGFDGRVLVIPGDSARAPLPSFAWALRDFAVQVAGDTVNGLGAAGTARDEVEDAVRAWCARHKPASNDEMAALVAGLFPDEAAEERALLEQLGTLDEAGVEWLLSR